MLPILSLTLTLALGLVIGLAACDTAGPEAAPSAAAAVTETPLAGLIENCNGEIVAFSGTLKEVTHFRGDANGGFHLTSNWNIKVVGTGDLGNEYRGSTNDNLSLNWKAGETFTNVAMFLLIGKGSTPDVRVKALAHYTINANGELTSDVSITRESDACD